MAKVRHIGVVSAPFIAGADYSASSNRYKFVSLSSGGTAGASGSPDKILTATGASLPMPIGVLQNCPCSGEEAEVAVLGFSKLRVSAVQDVNQTGASPIYQGNWLTSGSAGYGIKLTPGTASPAFARAMEDCLTGSAIIEVLLMPYSFILTAS